MVAKLARSSGVASRGVWTALKARQRNHELAAWRLTKLEASRPKAVVV
jgi:hypothetical protein